jgi:hypothetical protein
MATLGRTSKTCLFIVSSGLSGLDDLGAAGSGIDPADARRAETARGSREACR